MKTFYHNQWVTVKAHTQYGDLRQGAVHSQMHAIRHPGYSKIQVDYMTEDGMVVVKVKYQGDWGEDVISPEQVNDWKDPNDVLWDAETYDIFSVDITLDGQVQTIRPMAGKWNGYLGDDPESLAVKDALRKEIELRKAAGQKPDFSDQDS